MANVKTTGGQELPVKCGPRSGRVTKPDKVERSISRSAGDLLSPVFVSRYRPKLAGSVIYPVMSECTTPVPGSH
jgi:hypothetical protein